MNSAADSPHTGYSFGAFRFSPDSGELFDGHKTVQLRPQVAKLLDLLLRHAGTTVSREEIRAHLWKDNIVVEFEEGISACVRQLRMTLNDGADGTRYVQTIARRGYKFVHPVSPMESSRTSLPTVTAVSNQNTAMPAAGRRARLLRAVPAGAAAVLIVVLVSVLLVSRFHPWAATGRTPRRITIAVLPFTNVSTHRDLGVFGISIANHILDLLGPIAPGRLAVIANTSAMHYAGDAYTIKRIGHALGADYVLEGSVGENRQSLRISARLIRVSDQSYVWGQEYRLSADFSRPAYQALLIRIATHVAGRLSPGASIKPADFTVSGKAALAFELGRYQLSQRRPGQAYDYCRQAFSLDPEFAAAYVCTAEALLATPGLTPQHLAQARRLLQRGAGLNQYSAQAHLARGQLALFYDWNLSTARSELNQALRLNPGNGRAWQAYAGYLAASDRMREAKSALELAGKLDPVAVRLSRKSALYFYLARRYRQAVRYAESNMMLNGPNPLPLHILVLSLLGGGSYAEAVHKAAAEMRYLHANAAEIASVRARSRSALVNYFHWYLRQAAQAPANGLTPVLMADAYMHLGDQDKAIATLSAAVNSRSISILIPFISVWPSLHPLCKSTAFRNLTRKLGQPGCSRI